VGRWNKEAIYWDSCVFIALITGEERPNGEINGVLDCADRIDRNEIYLVTYKDSTEMEVLEANMSEEGKEMFQNLFARRNVIELTNHPRVQNLAKELREYYEEEKRRDNGKSIEVQDAYHLAAAIYYQVDTFYTFDDGKNSKTRGLLGLNHNVAGHDLLICKPPFTEPRLFT
jgi:predicted nucleic acid-binding protein